MKRQLISDCVVSAAWSASSLDAHVIRFIFKRSNRLLWNIFLMRIRQTVFTLNTRTDKSEQTDRTQIRRHRKWLLILFYNFLHSYTVLDNLTGSEVERMRLRTHIRTEHVFVILSCIRIEDESKTGLSPSTIELSIPNTYSFTEI